MNRNEICSALAEKNISFNATETTETLAMLLKNPPNPVLDDLDDKGVSHAEVAEMIEEALATVQEMITVTLERCADYVTADEVKKMITEALKKQKTPVPVEVLVNPAQTSIPTE